MKRYNVYLLCQAAGWSLQAALNIIFTTLYGAWSWRQVAIYGWGAVAGILCTHGFRAWIRRRHWLTLSPLQALPRVFFGSIVVGCAISATGTAAWPVGFGLAVSFES